MTTKQLLGITGAVVLFVGVFMPIVSIPIMGNMNYFQNGRGDGVILLVLAGLSLILVLSKRYQGLWFTSFGSLGVMLFTFIVFQNKLAQTKAEMETRLAGNPFRGFADMAMQSVQLQWGWAILVIGAVMLIAAAAMKEHTPTIADEADERKKCPECAESVKIDANKCRFCGHEFKSDSKLRFTYRCPDCGTFQQSDIEKCSNCGTLNPHYLPA